MAGIHDRDTYARLQQTDMGIDDGSWPSYRNVGSAAQDEVQKVEQQTSIGQQMHAAQTMINYLGSVVLPDLYISQPVNKEHVDTVKRIRSRYREINKDLRAKLSKQSGETTISGIPWTIVG